MAASLEDQDEDRRVGGNLMRGQVDGEGRLNSDMVMRKLRSHQYTHTHTHDEMKVSHSNVVYHTYEQEMQ